MRWRLKACPRCQGDVFMDRDIDGWFEQCLQCSFRKELRELRDYAKQKEIAGISREDWSSEKED